MGGRVRQGIGEGVRGTEEEETEEEEAERAGGDWTEGDGVG